MAFKLKICLSTGYTNFSIFNLSEKYRIPVLLMTDEAIGHMSEKLTIPTEDESRLYYRKMPEVKPDEYRPYLAGDDLVPPMAIAGKGYRFHTTGLTHDERGYPDMSTEAQDRLVSRLVEKIKKNKNDIIQTQEYMLDDADIIVCSYGITARISKLAVEKARSEGIKAGLLQLITVWPFAEEKIRELSDSARAFVVPELNMGQIVYEVERCACGKRTVSVPHAGGEVHNPDVILSAIREAAN